MKQDRLQQALVGLLVFIGITAALLGGVILVLTEELALLGAQMPATSTVPTLPPTVTRTNTPALVEPPDRDTREPDTPRPDTPRPDTPTRTATAIPDTDVTPSPTRRPTRTPRPTAEPTAAATLTQALTETTTKTAMTSTPTGTPCHIATGWVTYQVQPGDTIFLIGLRYGVRVDTMLKANCLSSSLIHVGAEIHVPPVTPHPIPTGLLTSAAAADDPPDPGPTSTLTATDGACTSPDSFIKYPHVGAVLTDTVRITGTARMFDFASFRLELRQEGTPQTFTAFFTGQEPVTNGTLAELDTRQWPNGEYWLRLVVVDSQSNYPERCSILVVFLNG